MNPPNVTAAVIGGFIEALMTGGETAAEAYLTAQFPLLANPIAQSILDWMVNELGSAIQSYLINSATGIVINIQTSSEQSAIVNAATALQLAQSSGDKDAINQAVENAKRAYQGLIRWDGTFSPP